MWLFYFFINAYFFTDIVDQDGDGDDVDYDDDELSEYSGYENTNSIGK